MDACKEKTIPLSLPRAEAALIPYPRVTNTRKVT
jgi:hypothetical protein